MPDPHRNQVIAGRFELHGLAGAGGMGSVFRARDQRTGLWVALKLMNLDVDDESDLDTEPFHREAQILAELRHPGIVSYITHGRTDVPILRRDKGQLFLVMEWLEGESLAARIVKNPLSIPGSMLVLRRVAEALAFAHERGIVHRDIKPTNLFLRGGQLEQVTLIDFGIARRLPSGNKLAARLIPTPPDGIALRGTPEYMAPEQARGGDEIGTAADIFSLGCVIYQCLTTQAPFRAGNAAAALAKILLETPKSLVELRPNIPVSFARLVTRMLSKDPLHRPANATVLLRELSEIGPLTALRERSSGALSIPAASGPPATAEAEQRLFCVVLATPAPGMEERDKRAQLTRELGRHGAQVEWLLDESLLVTCTSEGSAIDQAARAARCALLIKARWIEAEVVLATGRGVTVGQIPMGEAIDRATQLMSTRLSADSTFSADSQTGVYLDELSAGLLSRRFKVVRSTSSGGGWLLSEEAKGHDQTEPLLGKPTPYVGREQELFMMEALLKQCIERSESCALWVIGPSGIGKSRLRREFIRRWQSKADPAAAVEIRLGIGDPMNRTAPFKFISTLLRRLCMISGNEPLETQQFRLRQRLGRHLSPRDAEQIVEALGEMCGIPFPKRTGDRLPRPIRPLATADHGRPWSVQPAMVQAFSQFLRAESRALPQLLILEDLQWIDAPSVELLDLSLRQLADRPIMMMALGTPEIREAFPLLWNERRQEIVLKGLSRNASERLVRGVLDGEIDAEQVDRLAEQSGGNALFLEEMVRAIAEGKGESIPETVLAVLQARLEGLQPEARRLLRLASVLGQTFRRSQLQLFLAQEMDSRSLSGWLETLISSDLIEAVHDGAGDPSDQFRIRHPLVRAAAYSTLSVEDRVHSHCLAAQHLERQGEAPAHYHQALAALEQQQPPTPSLLRQHAEILGHLVRVSRGREPAERNLERIAKAQSLLRDAGIDVNAEEDRELQLHLACWLGITLCDQNQPQKAIVEFEKAIEQSLHSPHAQSLVTLPASLLGYVYAVQGHFGRARWLLQKLEPLLKEDLDEIDPQLVINIGYLGYTMAASGECRRALLLSQRAMEIAVRRGDPTLLAATVGTLGTVLMLSGEFSRSAQELRNGILKTEHSGNLLYLYANLGTLAWAQSRMGQHEAAAESMLRSEGIGRQLGPDLLFSDWHLLIRAEMALNRGQPDEACWLAEQAVQATQRSGGIFGGALAHRVWALSLSALGTVEWAEVVKHLAASLAGLGAGQALLEQARTHAVWGNLCCLHGHDAEARAHLQAACEQFLQSGLNAELAAAQAAMRALSM